VNFYLLDPEKREQFAKIAEEYWNSGRIEFHSCVKKHGVIRGIVGTLNQINIRDIIEYKMGKNSNWWNGDDVEFTYSTGKKRGARPWDWCGESMLYPNLQRRENENRNLLDSFSIGDQVGFTYDGEYFEGIIINKRKRATIYVKAQDARYYIPADWLTRV
jgi:hypothetical protein